MNIPLCHNDTGDQEAWQVRIRRRLDHLNNLNLPLRKAGGLKRRASAPEQHATKRHRISPRSSESNDAVATNDIVVTQELSVPPSSQSVPCSLCRISESRTDQSDFRRGDWIDIDVWVDSAFRGCNYCRTIASGAVHNFRPYRRAADNIKLRVRALAGPFGNMVVDMRSQNDKAQSLEFHITKGDSYCYSVSGPYPRIWHKSSKESQIHNAACAIKACVENHKDCHQNLGEQPSRLIELCIVNGENWVRLVETQTLVESSKPRYIALSYCWGSSQPLRLLKSNIASMKARIPWEAFPRLFRDAMELTWSLGVRYLWIDALCIIQDDSLDWQTESARMGDIYRSSFVTVLASTASDNGGTIFSEIFESLRDDKSWHLQVADPGLDVNNKIHTRAWTFQEFMLSRRVLELGRYMQRFHCCSQRKDGTQCNLEFPGDKQYRKTSTSQLYRARFDFNNVLESGKANDEVWFKIIDRYALRDLTRLSDRLPALSGLASLYLKQTGLKGCYLAGLWQSSFLNGLHWEPLHGTAHTISRYYAPSWSWSSLTTPVRYHNVEHLSSTKVTQPCAKVIHVQCEIKGSNPFGEVTGGTAVLRGLLLDARMSFPPDFQDTTSAELDFIDSTKVFLCSGCGAPGNAQPMPSWVEDTALPWWKDNRLVSFDSGVEMVPASRSLPRTCAYLRRRQQERQVDGLSGLWNLEEMLTTCFHVSVLILTRIESSQWLCMPDHWPCVTALVLGRPDPDKEVYERLALFRPRGYPFDLGEDRRQFIGAVKDVTII